MRACVQQAVVKIINWWWSREASRHHQTESSGRHCTFLRVFSSARQLLFSSEKGHHDDTPGLRAKAISVRPGVRQLCELAEVGAIDRMALPALLLTGLCSVGAGIEDEVENVILGAAILTERHQIKRSGSGLDAAAAWHCWLKLCDIRSARASMSGRRDRIRHYGRRVMAVKARRRTTITRPPLKAREQWRLHERTMQWWGNASLSEGGKLGSGGFLGVGKWSGEEPRKGMEGHD